MLSASNAATLYPEVVKKLVLIDSAGLAGGSPLSKLMFPRFDSLATEFLSNLKVRDRVSRIGYKNQSLASCRCTML